MKSFFKEKSKQICLSMMALFLILFGYFNYANNTIEVSARNNEQTLGDVELVNSDPEDNEYKSDIVSNEDLDKENQIEESNYFQETKIEREKMYSEMIENYQAIISNAETPEDQKSIAAQEISNITKIKNEIMVSENLIINKGFENVVILVNNGNINVVVKSTSLNGEEIAKIQNIVEREFDTELKNINISNK